MNPKLIILGISVAIALPVIGLALLSLLAKAPDNLGVKNGKLGDCPSSPNCVCSHAENKSHAIEPLSLATVDGDPLEYLKEKLGGMSGCEIIDEKPNYLHAVFTTRLFRFQDDAEFLIDGDVIHIRSASRAGKSDLGLNRKRIEALRKLF
ncbi:MAG: hypothetical protein CMJ78_11735 [Planctomycetaceae bacterium]|nr:hypothetical protein [Planctomycetaceae bacterium]